MLVLIEQAITPACLKWSRGEQFITYFIRFKLHASRHILLVVSPEMTCKTGQMFICPPMWWQQFQKPKAPRPLDQQLNILLVKGQNFHEAEFWTLDPALRRATPNLARSGQINHPQAQCFLII